LPAGALSSAPKRRLKGGCSQDWRPHVAGLRYSEGAL